jgi:tetratricopeptide (TPR) repeat protein
MSRLDQERNLGMGYLQYSDLPGHEVHRSIYRERSRQILEQVDRGRHDDIEVRAALAKLYWGQDAGRSLEHAWAVTAAPHASPEALATACFTLGSTLYALQRPAEAKTWLERTVLLRPAPDVWWTLSDCRAHAGDLSGALQAARNASEMAPDSPRYLERLVEFLELSKQAVPSDRSAASNRDAEVSALQKRIQILREYRARVGQTPQPER